MVTRVKVLALFIVAAGFVAMVAGCSHPDVSGFLGDYNGFKETGLVNKNLQYVNDNIDCSQYTAVDILPVRTYLMNATDGVSPTEVDQMTDFFDAQLKEQFAKYFSLTNRQGRGVVVVRSAITSLIPTDVAKNAAAQGAGFIPGVGIIVSVGEAAYKGATKDTLGMGQACMEVEFVDGQTGQRIFAYVAKKDGSSLDIKGQATRWGVVETIMKKWAAFLAAKMKKLQDPSFDEGIVQKIEQDM